MILPTAYYHSCGTGDDCTGNDAIRIKTGMTTGMPGRIIAYPSFGHGNGMSRHLAGGFPVPRGET